MGTLTPTLSLVPVKVYHEVMHCPYGDHCPGHMEFNGHSWTMLHEHNEHECTVCHSTIAIEDVRYPRLVYREEQP